MGEIKMNCTFKSFSMYVNQIISVLLAWKLDGGVYRVSSEPEQYLVIQIWLVWEAMYVYALWVSVQSIFESRSIFGYPSGLSLNLNASKKEKKLSEFGLSWRESSKISLAGKLWENRILYYYNYTIAPFGIHFEQPK